MSSSSGKGRPLGNPSQEGPLRRREKPALWSCLSGSVVILQADRTTWAEGMVTHRPSGQTLGTSQPPLLVKKKKKKGLVGGKKGY